jgi:hypothetical protein
MNTDLVTDSDAEREVCRPLEQCDVAWAIRHEHASPLGHVAGVTD